MPSRPFNVIYAFVLTEIFAAYILIRGILYPFIVSGMSTAQAIVGGVLQVLIAAGMTYFGLRFYRGRFGSRLPMILITLCALWVTASTLIMNVSAYSPSRLRVLLARRLPSSSCSCPAAAAILRRSPRRRAKRRRSTAADAAKPLARKPLAGSVLERSALDRSNFRPLPEPSA